MIIGKVEYLIGPASGLYSHPLDIVPMGTWWVRSRARALYSRGVALIHNPGRKGKSCLGESSGPGCVLGLPCKVKKFDSNRLFLTVIETA